jgi:EAL domain-containing protein (putative c-di-GMP-specific phosphodiesterase class I)
MPTIDRWVIRTAFARHRWFTNGDRFSINLSGTSLNSESIVAFIQTELEKTSLNADQVCFEITETAAITNITAAASMMNDLKKLGFNFALDDFGKGVSSYSYLNNLPVDYLKIDGEYVREINSNPVSYEIIRSVNEIAHLLGMETIAEYVENDAILATLKTIGIDYVQGFNFGLPQPLEDHDSADIVDLQVHAEPAFQA